MAKKKKAPPRVGKKNEPERIGVISDRRPDPKPGTSIVKRRLEGNVVYQLEMIRCGKETCHCVRSSGHGPYWYAYYLALHRGGDPDTGGQWRSKYIGKEFRTIK